MNAAASTTSPPKADSDKDTAPKHGNPAAGLSPNESVINVRVGSEATVESGTGPVLPPAGAPVSEATKVHNKDLRARDEKELEKRGPSGGVHSVSINFEGFMMVEVDERGAEPRSGSYTGNFKEKVSIRPATDKELEELVPTATGADRPRSATQPGPGSITSRSGR